MTVKQGREQVGFIGNIKVVVDWNDLLYYRGNLINKVKAETALGRLFELIAAVLIIGSFALIFIFGLTNDLNLLMPNSLFEWLPWVGALMFIYGNYLARDRSRFSFNLENPHLTEVVAEKMENGGEIEIDTHLNYQLWEVFDARYHSQDTELFAGLISSIFEFPETQSMMVRMGIDPATLAQKVQQDILHRNPVFDQIYREFFVGILNKALQLETDSIDTLSFFFYFAENWWKQIMLEMDIPADELKATELWVRNRNRKTRYEKLWEKKSAIKPTGVVNRAYTSRYAGTLEQYSEDYTREATLGRFEISIGRDKELAELIRVLQKDFGAAVIILGDPGVGKTQILKHLGVRMVVEDVPKPLRDHRLVAFDFNRAFTQNQSFDSFKLTLENVLDETAKSGNIILVLEDLDQMFNIRGDLQAEVTNLIVSAVDKYNLRVVATASTDGYNRLIKPIRALASKFQPITILEPSPLLSLQILIDEASQFERKYGVQVQVDALRQIVKLAPKFAYEKVMPDKAIDLLEESMLEAQSQGLQFLTSEVVNKIVSQRVGVSVGKISESESETLLQLENTMHDRVVGQDAAIRAVAAALRRSRAGLTQGTKPIASFMFFGPTGVGKTEVAKTLAETYYGDEKLMTRVDMSEYQEEKNVERLIGYNDGTRFVEGYLTGAMRTKPFSLLLLDELEKANPKVLDLFLQILDEGFLTDGAGRKVDFSNAIIIATSNAGSREIAEQIGEGMKYDSVLSNVLPILHKVFRVEFLNRFDKVIMFKPLLPIEVQEIARRILNKINDNLLEKGLQIQYTETVLEQLVTQGYNPVYGAREVRRVIQERIEDIVAEQVVSGQLVPGRTLVFNSLESYQVQ